MTAVENKADFLYFANSNRISLSRYLLQIQKGKLHGSIDVGLSVMSIKKRARRIDLDTEEHIYHLKVPKIATLSF